MLFRSPALNLAIAVATGATEATAFQELREYRILGSEILSASIIEPEFPEEPVALTISTTAMEDDIIIESDDDLSGCKDLLNRVSGSNTDYAQIVIHENSQTMNGVIVVQCAILTGLGIPQ